MECGDCEKAKGVHLTKIVDGQLESLHVCADCPKLGLEAHLSPNDPSLSAQFSLSAFLSGIGSAKARPATPAAEVLVCQACGLTFAEFRQTGRLGCHHDYEAFESGLTRLLRKIHGGTKHVGRAPRRIGERLARKEAASALEAQLKEAIAQEDYERAATLRDQLRELG
jgi:protein arginine kinase activator